MTPPVSTSRPQETSTTRCIAPDLKRRLEADREGRTLVTSFEMGISVTPSLDVKQRLKREFGLYSKGWEEPFSDAQLVDDSQREVVSLHMIAADAPDPARGIPKTQKAFLNNMVNQMKLPTFSGEEAEFADFAREWREYVRVMCPAGTASVGDPLLLGMLKKALDHASTQKLTSAMEANPNLTYTEFWRTLEEDFGRDLTGVYRKEWEKVSLGGVRNITPQMWRKFEADFELKARRVGDITDREKEDKIKRELPESMRHRLGEENLRVSTTRFWVKIPEPVPIPIDRLQQLFARLMRRAEVKLQRYGQAYLVDCGSQENVDAVRTLDGWGGDGNTLRVLSHSKGMTWKEMSLWVMGQLRLKEEDQAYEVARTATLSAPPDAPGARMAPRSVEPSAAQAPTPSTPYASNTPGYAVQPPQGYGTPAQTYGTAPPPPYWGGAYPEYAGWYPGWEQADTYPIQDARPAQGRGERTAKGGKGKGKGNDSRNQDRGRSQVKGGEKGGSRDRSRGPPPENVSMGRSSSRKRETKEPANPRLPDCHACRDDNLPWDHNPFECSNWLNKPQYKERWRAFFNNPRRGNSRPPKEGQSKGPAASGGTAPPLVA
jgi:hypothetical protein